MVGIHPVSGGKSYGSMHIPKTAGASFVVDAKKYKVITEGDGFYSQEHCSSKIQNDMQRNPNVTSLPEMITFLRKPTNHVYSQYLELMDDTTWEWQDKNKFAQQFPTFTSFLNYFVDKAGAEKPPAYSSIGHKFSGGAYHPKNMQTRSFMCKGSMHDFAETDLNMVLEKMESFKFIGFTEFYQESFCLLHDKIRPYEELPTFCNCRNPTEWFKFHSSRISHTVRPHSLNDLTADDIMKIDALTKEDVVLYDHGKTRFLEEIKELEQRRGLTILCE